MSIVIKFANQVWGMSDNKHLFAITNLTQRFAKFELRTWVQPSFRLIQHKRERRQINCISKSRRSGIHLDDTKRNSPLHAGTLPINKRFTSAIIHIHLPLFHKHSRIRQSKIETKSSLPILFANKFFYAFCKNFRFSQEGPIPFDRKGSLVSLRKVLPAISLSKLPKRRVKKTTKRLVAGEIDMIAWLRVRPNCLEVKNRFYFSINTGNVLKLLVLWMPETHALDINLFVSTILNHGSHLTTSLQTENSLSTILKDKVFEDFKLILRHQTVNISRDINFYPGCSIGFGAIEFIGGPPCRGRPLKHKQKSFKYRGFSTIVITDKEVNSWLKIKTMRSSKTLHVLDDGAPQIHTALQVIHREFCSSILDTIRLVPCCVWICPRVHRPIRRCRVPPATRDYHLRRV